MHGLSTPAPRQRQARFEPPPEALLRPKRRTTRLKSGDVIWAPDSPREHDQINFDDGADVGYREGFRAGIVWLLKEIKSQRGELDGDERMARNEWEHAETSYRRGYFQGAYFLYAGVHRVLPRDIARQVENWLFGAIHSWRYAKRRRLKRSYTRDQPPELVLR
jgi:hypothetical protein